ncbi:hypothetical protein HanPSC8_Chr10g0448321 [Helianthus annuus]|nr:hypothetical protein HanPSC8_Chr10g0448321 [Helianthus annuus]
MLQNKKYLLIMVEDPCPYPTHYIIYTHYYIRNPNNIMKLHKPPL